MTACLLMILLLLLGGCSSLNVDPDPLPLVDDRYQLEAVQNVPSMISSDDFELSQEIRVKAGTLRDIEEFFRAKTTKTLVSNAHELTIDGLYTGTPRQIAQQIAASNNLLYAEFGDTLYLVTQSEAPELRTIVALPFQGEIEELSQLFDDIKLTKRDNMIVAVGPFLSLLKLQDYLNILSSVSEQNYVITVVEVETSRDFALTLQLEIASKGIDLLTPNVTLYDVFSALARANGQNINADNYHERQLVVTSGQETTYSRSTQKKVEKRAISDQGTSTVAGYEDIDAGVILDMTVNSVNSEFVSLKYNVEISQFVGSSLDKTSVKVQSDKVLVSPGKVYYLASSEDRRKEDSLLMIGRGSTKDIVVSTIFIKIDKISK